MSTKMSMIKKCEETSSYTGTEVVGKEMWQGVDAQPRSACASYKAGTQR